MGRSAGETLPRPIFACYLHNCTHVYFFTHVLQTHAFCRRVVQVCVNSSQNIFYTRPTAGALFVYTLSRFTVFLQTHPFWCRVALVRVKNLRKRVKHNFYRHMHFAAEGRIQFYTRKISAYFFYTRLPGQPGPGARAQARALVCPFACICLYACIYVHSILKFLKYP